MTELATSLKLDGDGRILIQTGPLLQLVEGIEAGRVRQCSECRRVFWAGRMDKFACTKKCTQRRRVRLWRERYAEAYKLQRVGKTDVAVSGSETKSNNKRRRKPQ